MMRFVKPRFTKMLFQPEKWSNLKHRSSLLHLTTDRGLTSDGIDTNERVDRLKSIPLVERRATNLITKFVAESRSERDEELSFVVGRERLEIRSERGREAVICFSSTTRSSDQLEAIA